MNSRNKWNSFERKVMKEYKEWYPNCKTSRNESKARDDEWVDICNTEPFNIQCKNYTNFSGAKIIETLANMPDETNYNILHLKLTRKWEVVCISKDDWYEILGILKSNQVI